MGVGANDPRASLPPDPCGIRMTYSMVSVAAHHSDMAGKYQITAIRGNLMSVCVSR